MLRKNLCNVIYRNTIFVPIFEKSYSKGLQNSKIDCGPLTFITGEEMTRYSMDLVMKKWIEPYVQTSNWEFYDLSCLNRDATEDQVLKDAVLSGKRTKAIFKEPTVTPTLIQKQKLGLKKTWGSPNGAMRRGWNGVTISRDTIHIDGMQLGYKNIVICDRHAVGGEYGAGWDHCGSGKLVTTFFPDDEGQKPHIVDARTLKDNNNVAVVYHNPLDNVPQMAHIFFQRCLDHDAVPYVVTKKTVFKWQEEFWQQMKNVFDEHYRDKFIQKGLIKKNLRHLISDNATMQLLKWTDGKFGIACHNYDGDMLTDEVAMVHRSPGFLTSNLIGFDDQGVLIKEFEASHGTVADMWEAHLRGEETSFNPLGMLTALIGAMRHAAQVNGKNEQDVYWFTDRLKKTVHKSMVVGKGTRDISGAQGLTTESFIDFVANAIKVTALDLDIEIDKVVKQAIPAVKTTKEIDEEKLKSLFNKYDVDQNGTIDLNEFKSMMVDLNLCPYKLDFEALDDKPQNNK